MHLRYVGHSCLSIEMAGQHILTNPWWQGPAYDGLWSPNHPRVERSDQDHTGLVFITDEGEDHLHVPTLRALSRQATILVPRGRDLSLRDFLLSLGFENVIEMAHQRVHRVAPGIQASIYSHGDGNLLVVQGEGRTLLHANAALQTGSMQALMDTCRTIRQRHPRIDLLFASCHNHSWLPYCGRFRDETVLQPRQWDKAAEARFLQLVDFFEPRRAFPVEDSPQTLIHRPGISERTTEAPYLSASIDDLGNRVQEAFHPGDRIVGDQYVPFTATSRRPVALLTLQHRAAPLGSDTSEATLDTTRWRKLQRRILRNLQERAPRLLRDQRGIHCRIDLEDHRGTSLLLHATAKEISLQACDNLRAAPLTISTRLDVLESWANNAAGFRSLSTAMGAQWRLCLDQLTEASLLLDLVGRRTLPASLVERLTLWMLHPRRSWDIWNQRRQRCCSEEQQWALDRVDPYQLLQSDAAPEELPSVTISNVG